MDVVVVPIPPQLFEAAWPHAAPHITRGIASAGDVDLAQAVEDISSGDTRLWGIFSASAMTGAFLTDIREGSDGERFVMAYALGGGGLWTWFYLAEAAIMQQARHEGVSFVRFAGRPGWQRLIKNCRISGRLGAREIIFEKAVQS